MKHLVFDSLQAAQDRNAQVFADGMAAGLFVEGTNAYAELEQNLNGRWALVVDSRYENLFSATERSEAVLREVLMPAQEPEAGN